MSDAAATAAENNDDDSLTTGARRGGRKLLALLCGFRILNTFLVQSYFDPDEYWQTLEPAYCSVFGNSNDDDTCQGEDLTWEWRRRRAEASEISSPLLKLHPFLQRSLLGPVRTYLSVVPTHMTYWILRNLLLRLDTSSSWLVARGPMFVAAVTVAAPIDYAIWYTGRWLTTANGNSNDAVLLPMWCLFASLSSWFHGYTLVRTLANGQEALFLILAIALVSPELVRNNRSRNKQATAAASMARACLAFGLGGMGVAIRFTSVAAFVPMGILLASQQPTKRGCLLYLLWPCALFGLMGISVAVIVDRLYFGFWTLPFLGSFHFNVVQNQADLYGTHPWHWYLTSGLPTLTGLLFPIVLLECTRFLQPSGTNKMSLGERNLWTIVVCYLTTMSMNAHKEFRFILPVLPILCLLTASRLQSLFQSRTQTQRRLLLSAWVMANLVALWYLGLYHQSGPISVQRRILALATRDNQHTRKDWYSIHYLTGSCHSTPGHSHLHGGLSSSSSERRNKIIQFKTRHLDCSPECRRSQTCETNRFVQDPVSFLKDQKKNTIDFVVTMSEYVPILEPQLRSKFGVEPVATFPHHIAGIGWGRKQQQGDSDSSSSSSSDSISEQDGRIVSLGPFQIVVNEVVLFARPTSLPST